MYMAKTLGHTHMILQARSSIFQGIVRFRERGNQYQYLSESGSFVEVHFYRDSLLIDFLAALYAHTEGMESRDFSKSKLVSR